MVEKAQQAGRAPVIAHTLHSSAETTACLDEAATGRGIGMAVAQAVSSTDTYGEV